MRVAYQNVRLDEYIIHLIASFSFELILMPKMLLEEGYVRNISDLSKCTFVIFAMINVCMLRS